MDSIYSEKELNFKFGQIESTLDEETFNSKLSHIPIREEINFTNEDKRWQILFNELISNDSNVKNVGDNQVDNCMEVCEPDEENPPAEVQDIEATPEVEANNSCEDIVAVVTEKCNSASSKLKALSIKLDDEFLGLKEELDKLDEAALKLVLANSWTQLIGDNAKLLFYTLFTQSSKLCKALCEQILLPAMKEKLPNRLEEFSKILSKEGDTVCEFLICPLLQEEESALVKDVLSLEELLSGLSRNQCTTLLRACTSSGSQLQSWSIPHLVMIVDSSNPSSEDLQILVNLISATGTTFATSREFGNLLLSVANTLKPGHENIAAQMNDVVKNYKGSLKYKVLKVLSDFKD